MEHPLRAFRRVRGLTLEAAARDLNTTKGNLSRIETGVHGASDALKRRIAEWSEGQITPNDLVGFEASALAGAEAAP